jgi:hypothetical protein
MAVAMVDALRIVGDESQDDWVEDVANAASATQVASYALVQPGASPDLFVGAWLLLPQREHHQRERVVETYNPTTGVVAFPTFLTIPDVAVGERFQLWTRFRPTDVEQALLLSLKNMFQARATQLTGATIGGLRQVNLTAALPWLRSSNQVLAVSRYDGTSPSALEYVTGGLHVGMAALTDADPVVSLSVQGDSVFDATDTITVYTWANWRDATSDWASQFIPNDLSTGTTEAPEEWWGWEAIYRLARKTQYRDQDLETRAINELNRLRPYFSPESGYRAFEPRESWGPSGYGGY